MGDVLISLQNNTFSRADLSNESGVAKNVHYGDVLIKFGEVLDVSKEQLPMILDESVLTKYKASFLQNGDVIVADTAEDSTVGKCSEIAGLNDEVILSGLHTIPYRPAEKFATGYLGYYLNSCAYHNQLIPLMQGIKVTSISKSAMQDTDIVYPKLMEEQTEIGNYFYALDHLITLHQCKCHLLLKLLHNDWEQRKFGDLVEKYEDPIDTPTDGYMRLGIRSHAKGTFHSYVEKGKELETAKMFRVAANNFIVNITFGWEHAVAITDESDAGKLVSHRFPQYSFENGMIPMFFKYLILDENFKHHLELSSPGGAGRNRVLKLNDMLEYKMKFPCEDEQRKLASYFDDLDHLITLHQRKCEETKKLKKYMLQKMFPQNGQTVPEIRFSGFTDAWEQRKLNEYFNVSTAKNKDNHYGKEDVLSVSGDYGIVNQIKFQGRSFAGATVANYGVVNTGDVVYTKSPLSTNPYGIIKANKGKAGIVSTLYAVYKPCKNVNSEFVQVYFELNSRMNNYMQPLVNKGAKNDMKVTAENALKGGVCFPKLNEQNAIVEYFRSLDHLITLHQQKNIYF